MFRKFPFVVAPAFLLLLTAGAVQARPLAAHTGALAGLQELWHWVTSVGPESLAKEGPGMDPNGIKTHGPNPGYPVHRTGTRTERTATEGR